VLPSLQVEYHAPPFRYARLFIEAGRLPGTISLLATVLPAAVRRAGGGRWFS
jgi:hypothetical protein